MNNVYYDLKQVSSLFKTNVPYLRKLIKRHELKAIFIGRQYLIDKEDLKEFIKNSSSVKNER